MATARLRALRPRLSLRARGAQAQTAGAAGAAAGPAPEARGGPAAPPFPGRRPPLRASPPVPEPRAAAEGRALRVASRGYPSLASFWNIFHEYVPVYYFLVVNVEN